MNPKRTNSGVSGATDGHVTTGSANGGSANSGPVEAEQPAGSFPQHHAHAPDAVLASCDPGTACGGSAVAGPTAADRATARLVANSPKTRGQQLQDAWTDDPSLHPASKMGLRVKTGTAQ